MRTLVLTTTLVVVLAAAGCHAPQRRPAAPTGPVRTGSDCLVDARQALQAGDVQGAEICLREAETLMTASRAGVHPETHLLWAEWSLAVGDVDTALELARFVRDNSDDDPQVAARTAEVLGKVELHRGDFAAAHGHFQEALKSYHTERDQRRAQDLVLLAECFIEYAKGHLGAATAKLQGISDENLRASVQDAFAQSAQPS